MTRYYAQHPHVDGGTAVIDSKLGTLVHGTLPQDAAERITDALNALDGDPALPVNTVLMRCPTDELRVICKYVGGLARRSGA